MSNRAIIALIAGSLLMFSRPAITAGQETARTGINAQARADLQVLMGKVQTKWGGNKMTEPDLAAEIKEFDALLEKYKGQKSDDVAQILFLKAMLYLQILEDVEKGAKLIEQVKTDFPETALAKRADAIFASVKMQVDSMKMQRDLAVGTKFPDFEEKDLDGKPLSVANYKGKVVLVDFWATWCGPCVAELPNVLKAYEKYHSKGFDVVGISLDIDKARLTGFVQQQKMGWRQYFDGKGGTNKLAAKYGVQSIPTTYLLDGEGKIIAKNLRGEDLETELAKVMEKK